MPKQSWKSLAVTLSFALVFFAPPLAAQSPPANDDLRGNYNFLLEIAGTPVAQFASVTGLSAETEVVEYREGGDDNLVRKLPGQIKYSNIVLRRGFTSEPLLREWIWTNLAPNGTTDRRDGALTMRNSAGNVLVRYEFYDAWPCKWSGATPTGESDSAFVEEIVICTDYFREILPVSD